MESTSSFEKTEGALPTCSVTTSYGLDKFLLHEDFPRLLHLAVTVKELQNNASNSKKHILCSDNDMNDMIQKIQSNFLTSNGKTFQNTLVLSKGQCLEIDQSMKKFVDTMCNDLAMLKLANERNNDEFAVIKINQNFYQKGKDCADAFGVKYSKQQTDCLLNWMIQNKYHPFPDGKQIAFLAKETGLTNSQIINWSTNVRKRNLKGTVEGGKKPHQFLDFLFLAVHREKNPPLAISPAIKATPPRKTTTKKTKASMSNEKERSFAMSRNDSSYHPITPLSYPRWLCNSPWNDSNYQWRSSIVAYKNADSHKSSLSSFSNGPYTSKSYVPIGDNLFSSKLGVAQLPTLFDTSCNEDTLSNTITEFEYETKHLTTRRAVSPSFLFDETSKELNHTRRFQTQESLITRKKMKRSNSLTDALQRPELFWARKYSSLMEDSQLIAKSGGQGYRLESLWSDSDILREFTQGGLLNTPRDIDEDNQSLGEAVEDLISHRPDILRASLTENDIVYLLSTDEDDDEAFLDLDMDDKIFVAV